MPARIFILVICGTAVAVSAVLVCGLWRPSERTPDRRSPASTSVHDTHQAQRDTAIKPVQRDTLGGLVFDDLGPVAHANVVILHPPTARPSCPCYDVTAEHLLDDLCDCWAADAQLTEWILERQGEPTILGKATTNVNGEFHLAVFGRGPLMLWAEHLDRGVGLAVDVEPDTREIAIELTPVAQLFCWVLDDMGRSIAGAEVFALHTLTGRIQSALTDEGGHCELALHTDSEYYLVAAATGYFSTLNLVLGEEEELKLTLESPRVVSGTVIFDNGMPATDVDIDARGCGSHHVTTSNEGGQFILENLRPGEYYVMARHGKLLDGTLVDLAAGQDRQDVLLRLREVEGGELFGTVRDAADRVVAGARVRVIGDDAWGVDTAIAGIDGQYRIRPLAPGFYDVEVTADGLGRACAEVDILAARPTELDVALGEAINARGVVLGDKDEPIAGATVWLESLADLDDSHGYDGEGYSDDDDDDRHLDDDDDDDDRHLVRGYADDRAQGVYDHAPQPYVASHLDCAEPETVTRADGSFELDGLGEGEYLAVVLFDGPTPHEQRVRLPSRSLHIRIPTTTLLTGRVVNARGQPAPSALLFLYNADGLANPYEADRLGRFTIAGLIDGHYELEATPSSDVGLCPRARVEFDIAGGRGPTDLVVQLQSGKRLGGVILLADGRPVLRGELRVTHVASGGVGMTTIEDGRFAMDDLLPGRFNLEAIVRGFPIAAATAEAGDTAVAIIVGPERDVSGNKAPAPSTSDSPPASGSGLWSDDS